MTDEHGANDKYGTLQPVLISAPLPGNPDSVLSTTTGVLLRDQVGSKSMAVVSHGFPAECGTAVIHPLVLTMVLDDDDWTLKNPRLSFSSPANHHQLHRQRVGPAGPACQCPEQ